MLLKCLILVSVLHAAASSLGQSPAVVIGGLFSKDGFMRRAFSLGVVTMNDCYYPSKRDVCDKIKPCEPGVECEKFHQVQFASLMLGVDDDLLQAYKKVGELAGHNAEEVLNNEYGLAAIVGPHSDISSKIVQGLCEIHDLPSIIVKQELYHDRLRSINLYPDVQTLSNIFVQMVKKLNWTDFTILYEKTENFLALDQMLKMYGPLEHAVYAFHLGTGPNYSQPLLRAKRKPHTSLIIDCSYDNLSDVLKQTQEVGMMTGSYRYIVTSLDLHTIDLRPYQYSGVNISGIRMVDPDDSFVRSFVGSRLEAFDIQSVDKLRVEEALMFDAIALFTHAYKDLTYENLISGAKLSENYTEPGPWNHGLSLRNYILYNTINGLTGPVMLDSDGRRRRFKLDIMNLHETGLTKVGMWNPDDGFDDLRLMNELKIKHFNILITMSPPYASRVNFSKSLEGNDRFEGFVIDIIKELSNMIRFNYTFHVEDSGNNGVCQKDPTTQVCRCDGMLEKILNKKMDMAITDLTITEERELCVDFSTAFLNLGMSILYRKPTKASPTLFSFLSPFNTWVWVYLSGVYILVSLLFYVLGRLSSTEWNNPYPCIEEPTKLYNQFTLNNSFWFTGGAIMQQGSEIAPISKSTRILSGFWWFFCLIIVSTYTANLTAFLTIESPIKVVRSIDDLYNQTAIKFGAKINGSTHMYFKSSKNKKHKQIGEQMDSKEWSKYMVTSNNEGQMLAKKQNYAFLMESSTIEYVQYRECDLEQAGPLIDQKSYAIAFAEDFNYHSQVSRAISELQEKLVIKNLYDKWWKQKGAVCFNNNSNSAEPMNLAQLIGPFVVLGLGIFISLKLSIYEFWRGVKKTTKKENGKFVATLSEEVKLITKSKSVKPVLKRDRSTDSTISDTYTCDFTMTTQA